MRLWMQAITLRARPCKGRAAEFYHRSARLTERLIADCLERMTKQRLEAIDSDYRGIDW
jgi:hypothetical protein